MGDKPWSSGRILTPSQRERKRKIDKALKREKRKRTADMEARLYRLELLSSSQLERSRERNPQSSVTKYLALPCSTEKYWVPCLEDIEFNENESTDDRVEVTNEQDRREIGQYLPCNDFVYDAKNHPIPPLRTAIPQTFHLSQLQNSILGLVHSLNSTQVCTDETVNQDALIRGVTDGWHTLQDSYDPCPLWDILRKLDECIFFQAPMLSRLSLLKGAHMLLLSLIFPETTVNLPPWYRPRPSQLCFPHEIVVDYFPWPGLRERVILLKYPELTDSFWIDYTLFYQLVWSPASVIYSWDGTFNKYRLSKAFLNAVMDINNHSMKDEFFDRYPETLVDIRNMI